MSKFILPQMSAKIFATRADIIAWYDGHDIALDMLTTWIAIIQFVSHNTIFYNHKYPLLSTRTALDKIVVSPNKQSNMNFFSMTWKHNSQLGNMGFKIVYFLISLLISMSPFLRHFLKCKETCKWTAPNLISFSNILGKEVDKSHRLFKMQLEVGFHFRCDWVV